MDLASLVETYPSSIGTADGWTGSVETDSIELPVGAGTRITIEDAEETRGQRLCR
jgi:hypothetical protein